MKLDPRRYKRMLAQMRNYSLRNDPDTYPSTLAAAFRIAAGWTNEDPTSGSYGLENSSAYLADACFVSKAKDPEKGAGKTPSTATAAKTKRKSEVTCFACGLVGHYSHECPDRKGVAKVLLTSKTDAVDEEASLPDEYVAKHEKVLFSRYELLLDNQSSVNLVGNVDLITNLRRAEKSISMSGIQLGAEPVLVDTVGDFKEFGPVYFSEMASANILSFASQINAGADIDYDKSSDHFTLRPANSGNTYVFSRKNVEGSEGRFYMCDLSSTMQPDEESALVQTVADNLAGYTKREVEKAREAREMLARMSFPSVADAMDMANTGSNFGVSARDFQVADAI